MEGPVTVTWHSPMRSLSGKRFPERGVQCWAVFMPQCPLVLSKETPSHPTRSNLPLFVRIRASFHVKRMQHCQKIPFQKRKRGNFKPEVIVLERSGYTHRQAVFGLWQLLLLSRLCPPRSGSLSLIDTLGVAACFPGLAFPVCDQCRDHVRLCPCFLIFHWHTLLMAGHLCTSS